MLTVTLFAQVPNKKVLEDVSCKKIIAACTKAGFVYGVPQKKMLYIDCFNRLIQSQKVSEVQIDEVTISSCKKISDKNSK